MLFNVFRSLVFLLNIRHGTGTWTWHRLWRFFTEVLSCVHQIKQNMDGEKRFLYCRIHTAGHVLGLAVGELKGLAPNVVDTKAQHDPDAAYVEYRGSIDDKNKDAIQVLFSTGVRVPFYRSQLFFFHV